MLLAQVEKYDSAEVDMDRAIELMPDRSGYYINRALIRYYRENLRGAMADYDMALNADPNNILGYYNRGLLRAQVGDDNRAIEDFDNVLKVDEENTLARFNRALLRDRTGDLQGAISDYTAVIDEYPNFEYGYRCRAEARRKVGDKKGAADDETWLLNRQIEQYNNARNGKAAATDTLQQDEKVRKSSDRNVNKYNRVVVADDSNDKKYVSNYRGKVQNRKVDVRLEPLFVVSYYEKPHELGDALQYYKPIADYNSRNLLPAPLLLTNDERSLSESEVQRQRAGGQRFDIDREIVPQAHNGALAIVAFNQLDGFIQRLFPLGSILCAAGGNRPFNSFFLFSHDCSSVSGRKALVFLFCPEHIRN